MKYLVILLGLNLIFTICLVQASESIDRCNKFINDSKGNYKKAHTNKHCLKAAKEGNSSAQYSVGMGFGYDGNHDLEEKYYRLSANQQVIASYLSLGHVLSDKAPWEAIYWYQRYYSTKSDGYGYSAYRIMQLFEKMNDKNQSKYWRIKCRKSKYKGCK